MSWRGQPERDLRSLRHGATRAAATAPPAAGSAPPAATMRMLETTGAVSPAAVLGLQRTLGNCAVGDLLRHRAGGAAPRAIQRFPYTLESTDERMVIVAKLEGGYITLYRHGVEAGYLRIKWQDKLWELKDIIIHDPSLRGRDLGSVLIYLFAMLAVANGATGLAVLLPNGSGLYARNGFVITPNAVNPNNPPTITGNPTTVRNTALGNVQASYRITPGLPAPSQPARRPTARQIRDHGLINDNQSGNPFIGNDDL